MKKFASFLTSLLLLTPSGSFAQIACGLPEIKQYKDVSFTGYIQCDKKKFNNRDEFYRLSLTDNSGQICIVDIVADSDNNKDSFDKILKICPAGSRCTIAGDFETREGQLVKEFLNTKTLSKKKH